MPTDRIRTYADIQQRARQLRQEMTPAERCLWEAIRNRKLAGYKFRRQHPIGTVIVDFCCPEKKLVVEIDGPIHQAQIEEDQARTEYLAGLGYLVIRFTNDEVLSDLDSVLSRILDKLNGPIPPSPSMGDGAGG